MVGEDTGMVFHIEYDTPYYSHLIREFPNTNEFRNFVIYLDFIDGQLYHSSDSNEDNNQPHDFGNDNGNVNGNNDNGNNDGNNDNNDSSDDDEGGGGGNDQPPSTVVRENGHVGGTSLGGMFNDLRRNGISIIDASRWLEDDTSSDLSDDQWQLFFESQLEAVREASLNVNYLRSDLPIPPIEDVKVNWFRVKAARETEFKKIMIEAHQAFEMSSVEFGPWFKVEQMDIRIKETIQGLCQVDTDDGVFACIFTFQAFIKKSQWNGNYDPQVSFGLSFLKILFDSIASSSKISLDIWDQEKRMMNGQMKDIDSNTT
ncbi:hypothetical protein LIER_30731 [Lithospermum erythrorhizon]|uniref:Uncharacterized protein n=1 Tax=Lithospermum erythrorhizon TaxID=34254 RepID=A0AAV3RUH9_LITER